MVISNNIDEANPESLENKTTLNQEEVQEDSAPASSDSVSEDISKQTEVSVLVEDDKLLQNEKSEEIIHEAQNISEIKEEEEVSLSDFSWEDYEDGITKYSDSEYKALQEMYNETFSALDKDPVIKGTIIAQTDRDFIIDIGAKSEGVISINEFRYNPDFKVGDIVEVIIDKKENKTGQLVLSHKKARAREAWDKIQLAHENQTIVSGYVKCRTKGGMIVEVFGLESFLLNCRTVVKFYATSYFTIFVV